MKISFVIPCYRSEKTLGGVVAEIKAVVAQRQDVDYEIIMVSDHSPDDVYSVIERLAKEDPEHCRGLEFARNFGQNAALMAGFSRSTGDVVFSIDDDGQMPLESTFSLVDKLMVEGYDVVYGAYASKQHNAFRNLGSLVNRWMAGWLVGRPKGLKMSSFYAMKRFVVDEILRYHGPFTYIGGLIFRATKNIANVEVKHRSRQLGSSGYTMSKLIALWMNGFTAFSVKPLRFATWAGIMCAGAGFAFGLWVVIRKLFVDHGMAVGYSSLMSVNLFVGGMLMLMLGLVGEYIGRIYICINQSPQYVISREINNECRETQNTKQRKMFEW